jgi:outer membrane protein
MKRSSMAMGVLMAVLAAIHAGAFAEEMSPRSQAADEKLEAQAKKSGSLSLQECVDIALQNNRNRPVSRLAIEIAEAQYRQALSSYWPQLSFKATYSVMDEDPNFVFPSSQFKVALIGPPVIVSVPKQDVKLMNRENLMTSLGMTYPLYTGGLRGAIVTQAEQGLQAAKQEARRTDLQVIYDVRRMYYGAVLARELLRIGKDALARMEVTLDLTENLYKRGSGRVKKTDYLRNKTVVEGLRSMVAVFEANEQSVRAALVNSMGLEWDTSVEVAEGSLPFIPYQTDLKGLVGNAYLFNPDWGRLQAGLMAAEARIKETKSGHYPKVGLFGNLLHLQNSYDKGIVTPQNKNSWTIGVGLELPLFSGFRTTHEVKEAQARLKKLEEQKVLLKEGIGLQVKHLFIHMMSAQEQKKASEEAAKASEENRDLNERAYQEELVETKDVIEAQLVESMMKATYQKALFDHIEGQAHLDFVIGKEVEKLIRGE